MRLLNKWNFLGLIVASFVAATILSMIRVGGVPSPNYPNLVYIASQAIGLIAFSAIPALIISGIYKLITRKPVQTIFSYSMWILLALISFGIIATQLNEERLSLDGNAVKEQIISPNIDQESESPAAIPADSALAEEIELLSMRSVLAYYCTKLAELEGKTDEQRRLFSFASQQSSAFMRLIRNPATPNKIKETNLISSYLDEVGGWQLADDSFVQATLYERVSKSVELEKKAVSQNKERRMREAAERDAATGIEGYDLYSKSAEDHPLGESKDNPSRAVRNGFCEVLGR